MDAQDDFDALVGFLLPIAGQMLGQHDEFDPFAAAVSKAGEVIEASVAGLVAQAAAGEIRACGICSDATIESPELGHTDAARVTLEHADAAPLVVYLPYAKKGDDFEFGELIAVRSEPRVFPAG